MEIDIVAEINKAVSEMTGILVKNVDGTAIEGQVQSAELNENGQIVLSLG